MSGTTPQVEAYTASWIEICTDMVVPAETLVEAYTASWIEIPIESQSPELLRSRLIQPRGLKYSI